MRRKGRGFTFPPRELISPDPKESYKIVTIEPGDIVTLEGKGSAWGKLLRYDTRENHHRVIAYVIIHKHWGFSTNAIVVYELGDIEKWDEEAWIKARIKMAQDEARYHKKRVNEMQAKVNRALREADKFKEKLKTYRNENKSRKRG